MKGNERRPEEGMPPTAGVSGPLIVSLSVAALKMRGV